MLIAVDAAAGKAPLFPRHLLDTAETRRLEDAAQILLVKPAIVFAVLNEDVVQRLDFRPKHRLRPFASATDGVQQVPEAR